MRRVTGLCAAVVVAILLSPAAASADFTVGPPPVAAGIVSVDGISLNGHAGSTITVLPGADVQITATATDTYTACPTCFVFANVGFRGKPASAGCFGGVMQGTSSASGTVDLGNAPTDPGYYDIVVDGEAQFSCGPGWPGAGGTTIAQVWVQPADFTVPAAPIDGGAVSVSAISLNGIAGNTITVPVGGTVQITATVTNQNSGCPNCVIFSNTAFRASPTSAGCFGQPTILNPPSGPKTGTVNLGAAPTKPGFYDVIVDPEAQFSCGTGFTGAGTTIAQVRTTPLPTCAPVASSTAFGTPVDVTLSCTGASALTYAVAADGAPAHGTLGTVGGSGVRYTPAAGFSGPDSFKMTATDAAGGTAVQTVTVQVGAEPAGPPAPASDPPTPLPLTCSGRSITLLRVGISGTKVALSGLTLRSAAGKTVSLVAYPGGAVGTAVVGADGSFAATVKRPAAAVQTKVRYEAVLGSAHSARFKLLRQFTITSTVASATGTTVSAQLNGRVAKRTTLTVYRQVSCSAQSVFKRIQVPRSHKLKITFPRPPASDPVAFYRLVVKVARDGKSVPTTATLAVAVTAS